MFTRTKKVKVAVFGRNLQAELGKYEVSSREDKIKIIKGGKRNFNPSFNETSYLEMPKRFGGREKVYFVRSGAKACIDFKTANPEILLPDSEQVIEAAEAELIRNFGKDDKNTPWYVYVLMGMLCLVLLILLQ